jgi:G6PDH family F420-dependent oxidoreductase
MTEWGYALSSEEHRPQDLVRNGVRAEEEGFEFLMVSDHFHPWVDRQGHSPFVWSTIGGLAVATERVRIGTGVTCPTVRIHPAIIAQAAATSAVMTSGRFFLGVGSGENLNEHVVGAGWPPANVRHEMFAEALTIIAELFDGGYVNYAGKHFRVDSAKLWDLPERRVPIATAVSGRQSIELGAPRADAMIAVAPDASLVHGWNEVSQARDTRKIGQLPISWDTDRDAAVHRAHEQFRWFAGGWKVNAELPGPASFAAASQFVTEQDVAEQIPCGPDVDPIVSAVSDFWEAGFTDVALLQIGGRHQDQFFPFAERELLPALREAAKQA